MYRKIDAVYKNIVAISRLTFTNQTIGENERKLIEIYLTNLCDIFESLNDEIERGKKDGT